MATAPPSVAECVHAESLWVLFLHWVCCEESTAHQGRCRSVHHVFPCPACIPSLLRGIFQVPSCACSRPGSAYTGLGASRTAKPMAADLGNWSTTYSNSYEVRQLPDRCSLPLPRLKLL